MHKIAQLHGYLAAKRVEAEVSLCEENLTLGQSIP